MKGIFENVVADSNGKGRDPSWSARGMDSTRPDRPVISERVDGATTRGGRFIRQDYLIYLYMKRRWKSDRIVSLTKFFFFSGS